MAKEIDDKEIARLIVGGKIVGDKAKLLEPKPKATDPQALQKQQIIAILNQAIRAHGNINTLLTASEKALGLLEDLVKMQQKKKIYEFTGRKEINGTWKIDAVAKG